MDERRDILAEAKEYAASDAGPLWAHVLIAVYFRLWPFRRMQEIYRNGGFSCIDYLRWELKYRILKATWENTPEFHALPGCVAEYFESKYSAMPKYFAKDLDAADRRALMRAFSTQLGINWSIFPGHYKDFD